MAIIKLRLMDSCGDVYTFGVLDEDQTPEITRRYMYMR